MAARSPRLEPAMVALTDAIVDAVKPELLLLFGSRARGDARSDSDYDLLLVLGDGVDVKAAERTAYDLARAADRDVDILVRSAAEYARWQHDPGFPDSVVALEGRVLYASGVVPQLSPRAGRVSETPTEGRDSWITRGEEDFRAAGDTLSSPAPAWSTVTFLAHASVEKLIKASIVAGGRFPRKSHGLRDLLFELPTVAGDAGLAADCALLDGLYPRSRYGSALPTPDEARSAFAAASRLRARLLAMLSARPR